MLPRTVVLQSFRTTDVPAWLADCMASVRTWAESQGWSYEFMDDRFFNFAPDWVKGRCATNIYAVTDVCRLVWLQERLSGGFERVIWVDADVVMFAPERLNLNLESGYGFAFELVLDVQPDGSLRPRRSANNAVMVFDNNQALLDFYLFACLELLKHYEDGQVPRTALGPDLIMGLTHVLPLQVLYGVGLLSMNMMKEIVDGHGTMLSTYMEHSPQLPGAANLCHFNRNAQEPKFRPTFDRVYSQAVRALLESRGGVLERFPRVPIYGAP